MTKKQIIVFAMALVSLAALILIISWKYPGTSSRKKIETTEETRESGSLSMMEVYPENVETSSTSKSRTGAEDKNESDTEKSTKSWRDTFYTIDAAELENQTEPSFDYYYRPNVGSIPANVTGITEKILKAVDGKEGALVMAVQIEVQHAHPGAAECEVQIFQEHESGTLLEMIVNGDVVGILLYNRETGMFEGAAGVYSIP